MSDRLRKSPTETKKTLGQSPTESNVKSQRSQTCSVRSQNAEENYAPHRVQSRSVEKNGRIPRRVRSRPKL